MSSRIAIGAFVLALTVGSAAAAEDNGIRAAPPQQGTSRFATATGVGALAGAAVGAIEGAWWGTTIGEEGAVPLAAALVGGLGAVSGAITGGTIALVPEARGWSKYLQAAAIGMAVSGATFWAFGAWIDDPGGGPRVFRRMGIGHGAVTAIVVVKLTH
jgi:hypothetical protein